MTRRISLVTLAMCASLFAQGAVSASSSNPKKPTASKTTKGTTSYRWVDEHGVTHYGDSVPPQYASQGRSELNSHGVPVREFPRQLSAAEAANAQVAAAEAAKLRQHDSFLLNTYTKVSDIEQLRDERLALIDGQMEIARGSITASDTRLTALQTRMQNFLPYSSSPSARRLPDQVAGEAVRAINERRRLEVALASREKEKIDLRTQFDADIARYRELTTLPANR
jgi:Domain of unknown function (DUF4124)